MVMTRKVTMLMVIKGMVMTSMVIKNQAYHPIKILIKSNFNLPLLGQVKLGGLVTITILFIMANRLTKESL